MRLYRTETRDFSDEELLAVKESLGQLYADVSRKLAPDDFERDLRLLVRSSECESCELRDRCTGSWEVARGQVFRESERAVHAVLAALSGRVLDVGAGEARYLSTLAPAIQDGRIEYVALDPDAERLELLRSRLPQANVVAGTLEDGDVQGPFDHVLLLRSLNHVRDVAPALRRVVDLVRPGGSIVIADDVPFGVLREKAHARAAERGPAGFEHFRNDDAGRALRRFDGLPVRVVERTDVRPGRANHWMLRLERTAAATGAA
jgi:SAM-dependent methyltransferase